MAETEKNEILLAIKKLDSKIDNLQKEVSKIPDLEKEIKELKTEAIPGLEKEIKELKTEAIPELQNEIKQLKVDIIPEMQEEIRKISKSVAVIELEHGEKLDLLFDIFDMQQEKLRIHEKRIQLCEKHLDRHDDEIYYLKEFLRA